MTPFSHKAFKVVLAACLLLALLVTVATAPLWLEPIGGLYSRKQWEKLSFVGQTFGVVATIISALGLIVVAGSLLLQRRESQDARLQNLRELHAGLLEMAIDDRDLRLAWGPFAGGSHRVQRQHLYVNLVISHWQMAYYLGELSENQLRLIAAELFSGKPGVRYWKQARNARLNGYERRRDLKFHRILDEVFHDEKP